MKWEDGRQNSYYQKMKIFSFWSMDCYLIRYSKGCAVGYHTDDIPGKKHYRMNLQLKGVDRLCLLDNLKSSFKNPKFIRIFRADKMHSFGPSMESGLILSFGLAV